MRVSASYRASLARAQVARLLPLPDRLDICATPPAPRPPLVSPAPRCWLLPHPGRQLLYYAATLPEASQHFSPGAESQRAAGRFGVCEAKRKSLQLTDPEVAPLESRRCLCRINNAADKFSSGTFSPLFFGCLTSSGVSFLISPYSTFGPEINILMSPHEDVTARCGGKLLSSRLRLNLVLKAGQLSSRTPSQPEEEQNDSVIVT